MRDLLDQMAILEEQAGQQPNQQPNPQQKQQKSPQEQMFDAFVSSIIKEFMVFIRQKQQKRTQQNQQPPIPKRPPGFNPA